MQPRYADLPELEDGQPRLPHLVDNDVLAALGLRSPETVTLPHSRPQPGRT